MVDNFEVNKAETRYRVKIKKRKTDFLYISAEMEKNIETLWCGFGIDMDTFLCILMMTFFSFISFRDFFEVHHFLTEEDDHRPSVNSSLEYNPLFSKSSIQISSLGGDCLLAWPFAFTCFERNAYMRTIERQKSLWQLHLHQVTFSFLVVRKLKLHDVKSLPFNTLFLRTLTQPFSD